MATELLNRFPDQIETITLHQGFGGAFEVSVNGEQVYSKLQTQRYPELSEISGPVQQRAATAGSARS
jgi:selenoprotein W-related protein